LDASHVAEGVGSSFATVELSKDQKPRQSVRPARRLTALMMKLRKVAFTGRWELTKCLKFWGLISEVRASSGSPPG
jgi:hypothetical protein